MSEQNFRSGGCQCGAVRFRVRGELGRASICHCRMCQKHFGSFFGAFVNVPGELEWTHETPSIFQSSVNVERGFCTRCGTPLFFRSPEGIDVAIGVFDQRDDLQPTIQLNHRYRLPWVEEIFAQPTNDSPDYYSRQEAIISFQHPDREVENWPAHGLRL